MATFEQLIKDSIKKAGLKKGDVTNEIGLHVTSFSRTIRGKTPKATAISIIHAINKLAGKNVVNEHYALGLLGYDSTQETKTMIDLGHKVELSFPTDEYTEEQAKEIQHNLSLMLEVTLLRLERGKDEYPEILDG